MRRGLVSSLRPIARFTVAKLPLPMTSPRTHFSISFWFWLWVLGVLSSPLFGNHTISQAPIVAVVIVRAYKE